MDLREVTLKDVRDLFVEHHGYKSAGTVQVYAFAVFEGDKIVAAYVWQPPPPGAARAVCPEAPHGVLALSRMVALPKGERELRHVSKPLRKQMRSLIDRTRWPVLLTYSDEGLGHTGHVYLCSGWEKTARVARPVFSDEKGARASSYSNGRHGSRSNVQRTGKTHLQRWEHWACPRGTADAWMASFGWRRVAVVGKVWRSGRQAFTIVKRDGEPSRLQEDS